MSIYGRGFDSAQRAYENQMPPEIPEPELTHVDVIVTIRVGMDVDLSDYNDGDPILTTARAFARKEVEDYLRITGNYNGDTRSPIPMDDVEMYDFEVEVRP